MKPRNCLECAYYKSCNSAMRLEGCRFYPPIESINLFKKFFDNFLK